MRLFLPILVFRSPVNLDIPLRLLVDSPRFDVAFTDKEITESKPPKRCITFPIDQCRTVARSGFDYSGGDCSPTNVASVPDSSCAEIHDAGGLTGPERTACLLQTYNADHCIPNQLPLLHAELPHHEESFSSNCPTETVQSNLRILCHSVICFGPSMSTMD